MRYFRCGICPVVVVISIFLLHVNASAQGDPALNKKLSETIATTRTGKTSAVREAAAERLAGLTHKIDPKKVDDRTIADMVTLLDTTDDSVRAWVAISLGQLGLRAKAAAPELLKILPESDCLNGAITSAGAIRHALTQMGIKPPPFPKCAHVPIAG